MPPRFHPTFAYTLKAALVVFVCSILCAWTLIWSIERQNNDQERTQVADLAGDHTQGLQRSIESALSANNALGALVRQGNGSVYEFEAIGSQMLPFYPGIAALGLAPGGIIESVVPMKGNEILLGFDQLRDPVQGAESARARDSGQLTLVGPINLIQGGLGVVGRQPVYLDTEPNGHHFWGFTFVTLRISEVLQAAHLHRLAARGYRYRLWRTVPHTGVAQDIHVSSPPPGDDPVVRTLSLPNGQWFLSVTPAQGWGSASQLVLHCILGLGFSLLMAYLTWLLFKLKAHEKGLEALVAERTREIQALAHFDSLTGLPNRALLAQHTQRDIEQERECHGSLAVLFLDLDHFKNVNDSLGHRIGDILLVAVSKRLLGLVRKQDTVSRLGGDEFLILLPGNSVEEAEHAAIQILTIMAQPFQIEQYELITTSSIGIAIFPADGDNFDTLYQRADAAMYSAKRSGRNRYGVFTADLETKSARTLLLENALHRALKQEQFEVYYQPQVSLQTGQIVGAEALLRWHHPELGMISPAEFIPIAENSGMIVSIGEWVLKTAVHDAKRWVDQQLSLRTVSVNLSAVQFRHPKLPETVAHCLQEAGLSALHLELELTEGAAIDDPDAALAVMHKLHACGARLSMDDFGTGYSSLSQLKRFPLFKLKIDQSFVRDLSNNASDRAIVTATIRMAQALGMQTTAEGVETEAQRVFLLEHGCNEGQGYLFSRPLPVAAFETLLQTQKTTSTT